MEQTRLDTYHEMFMKYKNREISLEQLKQFQFDPKNYRLESPSANRSHLYEQRRGCMIIVNSFDAALEADFSEFKRLYSGDINQINPYTKYNLLETLLCKNHNMSERIDIARYLIDKGIDVNHLCGKYKRNALHLLFFNFLRGDIPYLLEMTKLLVSSGVDVNAVDKFNAIPLNYAISICKGETEDYRSVYEFLLKAGSDYNLKDFKGKSCLDYAKEFSWRNGFIKIVEDFENDK